MAFTLEHDQLILEAYFRNGERDANGQWTYSTQRCANEFIEQYPDLEIDYDNLIRHIRRIVTRFRSTGSVCKGKSTGRPSVMLEDTVEDVRARLEHSPTKPLRQLAQQIGKHILH